MSAQFKEFVAFADKHLQVPSADTERLLTDKLMHCVDITPEELTRALDTIAAATEAFQEAQNSPPCGVASCELADRTGMENTGDTTATKNMTRSALNHLAEGDFESAGRIMGLSTPSLRALLARARELDFHSRVVPAPPNVRRHFLDTVSPTIAREGYRIKDIFEVKQLDAPVLGSEKGSPNYLLYHGTRNHDSLQLVIDEGLQLKGIGGRLGKAIYLADSPIKSLQYAHKTPTQAPLLFLVEAKLGRVEYTEVDALGAREHNTLCARAIRINDGMLLRHNDGTTGILPTLHEANRVTGSHFLHNEYAIRDPRRLAVRYVIVTQSLREPKDDPQPPTKKPRINTPPLEATNLLNDFRKRLLKTRMRVCSVYPDKAAAFDDLLAESVDPRLLDLFGYIGYL